MMRVGIIGLGMAVEPHARALLDLGDRVQVGYAFSPSEARRVAFAQKYGLPVSDSIEPMLADPTVDAVLVLTPPNTHLELVERVAAAGKHILLEKPLEVTVARSEAILAAAHRAGVSLGIVFQNRFSAGAVALRELVSDGRLGQIVAATARINNWRPQSYYDEPGRGTRARDGGGVLLTQAIHILDLLVAFAGLPEVAAAFTTTTPVHRMETEDLAVGSLRFANGALGTVSATTAAYPGRDSEIELIGTKGAATLTGRSLRAHFHDGSRVETAMPAGGSGAGADPMDFSHDLHRALVAAFADAIEAGRDPRPSGEDALRVHRLIEAMLASSARGGSAVAVARPE